MYRYLKDESDVALPDGRALLFLWFSVIPTLTGWAIQRAPLRGGLAGVIESVPQHFAGVIVPTGWSTG
jgi:hypothetical protein